MKKCLIYLLVAVLCVGSLAGCKNNKKNNSEGLTAAADLLYGMYKDNAKITANDYEVVSVVKVDGVKYTVTWEADDKTNVQIVAGEEKTKIDVNEKNPQEVTYKLTATISDSNGNKLTKSFEHSIPAYVEFTYAQYVEACKKSTEAGAVAETVTVQGIVTAVISKANGNTHNALYFQDNDGAYYAYDTVTDPVEDGIEVGMLVSVTGTVSVYSGTYEITNGKATILDSTKKPVTPVDFTEKFTKAEALTDAALADPQSLLVTLKGVEISDQDVANGYFNFELAGKKSYIRISSSVCPIVKEKDAFIKGHSEHNGWIADATGIICLFNGAFYLTPVTVDAFNYINLPTKTDAEMVAFEKANISVPAEFPADAKVALPAVGGTYSDVKFAWALSDDTVASIEDGNLIVTLGDEAKKVTLTATITCGSVTETQEIEISIDAASSDAYIANKVSEAKAGTFKLAVFQNAIGKTIYFTGAMNGNYLATSANAAKAVDVTVEEVDGGYRLSFMDGETKKYIDIYEYQEGKAGVQLTETPTATYTWNADACTFVAKVAGDDRYLGCYKTYDTISVSATSYISGDNAANVDVSQFPSRIVTLSPAIVEASKVTEAKAGTFKLAVFQNAIGKTIYFTGAMNGNYLATSANADKAVDVTVEEVDGGYRLSFMDGDVKKYIDIYEYQEGKAGVQLTETPTATYTWNADACTFVAKVAGDDRYLGCYKTYDTISVSATSYISGDNAANVDVSQFPSRIVTLNTVEVKPVIKEAAEGTFKLAVFQNALGQTIYFTGAMNGNYLATDTRLSKAVDVTVEAVDGGFRLSFMDGETKKYIDIYEYQEGKAGVQLTETPTATYTWNADAKTFVAKVAGDDRYLGCYKTYNTISVSATSYISGDNAANVDVSQFPSRIVVLEKVSK